MSHDQFPGSPGENILDSAESMEEFQEKVEAFANKALAEVAARYNAGERDFSVDYFIDRSRVNYPENVYGPQTYHQWVGRIPLNWFQNIFYNIVDPEIVSMEGVISYADYTMISPGASEYAFRDEHVVDVREIMHYRLIVDEESEDPDISNSDLKLLPVMLI
jgi:hypothetical protein